MGSPLASPPRPHRLVAKLRVLEQLEHRVQPEPRHAALHPEPHDVVHGLADLGVPPVQIRLFLIERVVVELAPRRIVLPRAVPEDRQPVVGRPPEPPAVAPHVPVRLGVVSRRARFQEPLVPLRGVVHHQVRDYPDVAFPGLGHQLVEVRHGPVLRVDSHVVGNVISEIHLRRGKERRDPDRVHAQAAQVVQVRGDAVEVAHAVAVGVGKTARINFVDDGVLPPVGIGRIRRRRPTQHRHRQVPESPHARSFGATFAPAPATV